jgi:Amt family ammonium transporter
MDLFRDAEARKVLYAIVAGKGIGLALVVFGIAAVHDVFDHAARAADALPAHSETVNPLNTVWTLSAAFLVFFMQSGFLFLEAGFARTRETVNVLLEGIVDTCLCGALFWAFGFAFMFGSGNGFIGHEFFFLQGTPDTYGSTGVPMLAFWLFQFAFADTCSTITSGAMVGRTAFAGDLWYSIAVSGFIYPILGHWAWGRTDGSPPSTRTPSTTSPGRRSSTRSAASWRWPAQSPSARGSGASSPATGAASWRATT